MKKKERENVQGTGSKSQKSGDLKTTQPVHEERKGAGKPVRLTEDPRFAQAVQNYEAGLKCLQAHKYDNAKGCFEKVVAGPSPELAERAGAHLKTCNQHINRDLNTFKSPEEKYDYAVSLMNTGDYMGARDIFNELRQQHPKLDFVWYGAAALNCLMGHFPEAISGLNEAIRLNPANRFQARNDSDFKSLADDPRFTELLYPDTSAAAPAEARKWHF